VRPRATEHLSPLPRRPWLCPVCNEPGFRRVEVAGTLFFVCAGDCTGRRIAAALDVQIPSGYGALSAAADDFVRWMLVDEAAAEVLCQREAGKRREWTPEDHVREVFGDWMTTGP
jgi:hypothetical protein